VGAGIAQSEHVERVARLAYTDELTGLANRRAFEDRLDDAVASHRAHGTPVGLVVADINGLKRINDQLGHHVGDSSLMTFAEELSAGSSTLPGTLAVRLSGDEFCLLAVGASGDEVAALADDICRRGSSVLEEGVACGVASTDDLPTTDVTPARLLRAADAAQYRAKRSGLRVPVVAGRTREGDSLDLPGSGRERRRFRGRGLATAGEVLDELVRRLDDTVDHDPQRRLAEVGRVLAQTVDAAGWFVSRLPAGSTELGTVEAGIVRRNVPDEDDAYYAANDSYPLEEYPATYAALHGHAVLVDVDDPRSDPAETSLLALGGLAQMLMAGGADGDGDRWLLEVVGDALSTPMRAYTTVVRAGVALALRA
jgi:diguanylate cyclase (GGDEF)-like protein